MSDFEMMIREQISRYVRRETSIGEFYQWLIRFMESSFQKDPLWNQTPEAELIYDFLLEISEHVCTDDEKNGDHLRAKLADYGLE